MVHARGASKGVGEPANNKNNHPFTSTDRSLALVHNGRVDECEYRSLKQKYETNSDCDSEILLRIIEAQGADRLEGIKRVYSLINEGHMTVALGERRSHGRRDLWLFRNPHRPLWLIDIREKLGQIFFISEPSIWEDAVSECANIRQYIKSQKLIEVPHHQVWHFALTAETVANEGVQRFQVHKSDHKPWCFDGTKVNIDRRQPSFPVITELNEYDLADKPQKAALPPACLPDLQLDLVDSKCDEIIDVVNNIRQYAEQLANEQSLSKSEYERLLANLEQQRKELVEISSIINR